MVAVWAKYSDRMRADPITDFIVSDPSIKEGTLDDFGAAVQVDLGDANWHFGDFFSDLGSALYYALGRICTLL